MCIVNEDLTCFTESLLRRAHKKLNLFETGLIHAKQLKYCKGDTLYKLDVGHYRLISKDRKNWTLITHESYNHLFQFKH